MLIVFATIFVIYIIIRSSTNNTVKKTNQSRQNFWNKEYKANETRKKDISSLSYITIPLETLPIRSTTDEVLVDIYKTIHNLSTEKLLNLTGVSNTDIKLQYGVGNLATLMQADNNFTLLVSTLNKWGTYLYQSSNIDDAKSVLLYGVTCKTDISNNYTLLATIYKEQNKKNEIDFLINQIDELVKENKLSPARKKSILDKLNEIKES